MAKGEKGRNVEDDVGETQGQEECLEETLDPARDVEPTLDEVREPIKGNHQLGIAFTVPVMSVSGEGPDSLERVPGGQHIVSLSI